jgi:hypothetical protein
MSGEGFAFTNFSYKSSESRRDSGGTGEKTNGGTKTFPSNYKLFLCYKFFLIPNLPYVPVLHFAEYIAMSIQQQGDEYGRNKGAPHTPAIPLHVQDYPY